MVYGAGLRLDKFLWFARLAPSRSQAQDLCESRRLRIDGRVVDRASALVRAGSVLSWPRGDEIIVVRVEGLPERRGPYVEARGFYTDLTPGRQAVTMAAQHDPLPEGLALA
ncbi:RNA-binding S4 domain-containing protein [Sandarakinorhabdus cyanobacteriorum]|uniref:RNA-binding S4 domain-containing protein n=1 Tax=Sandarakinorhabdus cyanobacteriorum TaxID=1981098 RepID=UPI0026B5B126